MKHAVGTYNEAATTIPKPRRKAWYRRPVPQMLVALVLGAAVGVLFPHAAIELNPLSAAFLKIIRAIVGVVIFSTIVTGVASMGSGSGVRRMGIKSIIYFEVVTTFAMLVGLVIADLFKPGSGMDIDFHTLDASALSAFTRTAENLTVVDFLLTIIPDTFVSALTHGNILPVLLMAVLFGIGLLKMGPRAQPVVDMFERFSEAIFGVVGVIMALAPLAVFGAVAFAIGKYGIGSMIPLAKLLLIFYVSCVLFIGIVLGAICAFTRVSLWSLVKYLQAEIVLAFSTASSEAILPSLLKKLERAGCQKHVVGFVIPAGLSFNLDGSSMYFVMAVVFVAQACNVQLTLPQELSLIAIFMLTSKGIAGVVGAGFVALAGTLSIYQAVPLAGIVLLLGVDRFMDSMRTITNVIGNAVATLTIAAWEKARDDTQMHRAFAGDFSLTDED